LWDPNRPEGKRWRGVPRRKPGERKNELKADKLKKGGSNLARLAVP